MHNAPNEPRAVAVSGASAPQERDQAPNEREKSVDLLVAATQDHNAGILGRWIRPDVAKATVKSQERAPFHPAYSGNPWIRHAAKPLARAVVTSWPADRNSAAAVAGRFSSVLNCTVTADSPTSLRLAGRYSARAQVPPHMRAPP